MIETTHKCDLCGSKYATRQQWHYKAIENNDPMLDYSHVDLVNFPPGWQKVGAKIVCNDCMGSIKETINTVKTT